VQANGSRRIGPKVATFGVLKKSPLRIALIPVAFLCLPASAQDPVVAPDGVVNAATGRSFSGVNAVVRGSLVSIYGSDLAAESVSANGASLATQLAGTRVLFEGTAAPLLFVSPGQINAQVPFELPDIAHADLVVQTSAGTSSPIQVTSLGG